MWSAFRKNQNSLLFWKILLAQIEKADINQATCKFSAVYLKSSNCNGHGKLEGFVWEKQLLSPSHASVVFHTNPWSHDQLLQKVYPSLYMGNSWKYPYHTMGGFLIYTPPLHSEIPKWVLPQCPQNSINIRETKIHVYAKQ